MSLKKQMKCLNPEQIMKFLGGSLSEEDSAAFEAHLDGCPVCLKLMAAVARLVGGRQERWWQARSDEAAAEGPGRYRVRGEHARGGQARILVAYDTLIGRDVALKELRATPQNEEAGDSTVTDRGALADRFLREARITGQLDHPAIVQVYDVGRRSDGTPYYIMPIVRGRALATALSECGDLDRRMKLLVHFVDMCHGVAYAHSRGVLHRDIKPHNVMIGQFGETVLVDWGLAKVRGLDERAEEAEAAEEEEEEEEEERRSLSVWGEAAGAQTVARASVGTPAYMSPEQAAGRLDDVDERSDIWALGAVLYEILTGRPPFHGRTASEIIGKACKRPVPPVAKRCPEAPVELAAVAEKALQRDKDSRYEDAGDLAEEVSAYMTGHRVRAYEYSSWELARLFASRNKSAIAATGLALSVIVASLVLVSVSYRNESIARRKEQAARAKERRQRLVANYGLAQAYASRADRLFQARKPLSARVFAARSLVCNPANPNGPWHSASFIERFPHSADLSVRAASILWQTRFSPVTGLKRVLRTADAVQQAVFSPDGLLLASAGYDRTVILWNLETGRPLKVLRGHTNSVFGVALSPDEKLLASASYDKTVRMWIVRTGRPVKILRGHTEPVFDVAFSPDGRMLASASHDRTIRLWDVSTHASIATLKGHKDAVFDVAFSPDGRMLASASADKTVGVWDVGAAKPLASLKGHRDAVYGVAFSPDGKLMASASADRTVGVWDIAGARPLATLAGHRDAVYGVSFSPNSEVLASASFDKTVRMWNLVKAKSAQTLEGHRKPVHGLTFSPDGRLLASAGFDKTVRIWDITRARLTLTFEGHGVRVHDLAFSPDGQSLVSAGRDGIARVWDLIEEKLVLRFARHNGTIFAVAFSPDGRRVASAGRDGTVMVWSPVTGQSFLTLRGHDKMVFDVVFSPDGRLLASASKDRTVVVWDAATGQARQRLHGHRDWASGVDFSPDGRELASAGKDGVVILWDVDTWQRLKTLRGHRQWVNRVRYSRGGEFLVTAGDDRTAMIWSAATGRPLLVISANSVMDSVDVDISPDAKTVAVPDGNHIRLYPLDFTVLHTDPRTLLEAAETAAGMRSDAAVPESVRHGEKQDVDVCR